jgi:5-methylcytosine-specific restriction endonuclease McrBC regulatory subunit McrC
VVDPGSTSSLIHCHRIDSKTVKVRVLDAVGMVATPTVQLNVRPKIPVDHLLHLLRAGDAIPRVASESGQMSEDDNLAVLVARWFVTALERVLEEGLARDYRPHRDEIPNVRGRVALLETARLYYRGRLAVVAEFEEFDFDTPLNRLLLHASRLVASGVGLPEDLRRRALRGTKRMDGAGAYATSDFGAHIDRRTAYYADAALLARQIVQHSGRTLEAGFVRSWSFLLPTPTPVEAGVRATLQRELPSLVITKRRLTLQGSTMTINPDLVLGDDAAVADIKYKLAGDGWERGGLYEVVAFATGFRTDHAAILDFSGSAGQLLQDVVIGDVRVRHLSWPTTPGTSPEDAVKDVASQVLAWSATWAGGGAPA